jgi:Transposase domain (DUF772)
MGGDERVQGGMFSYVTLEQRVPGENRLRKLRKLTDEVLRSLSAEFDALYSDLGRRSIAPEYVLRALLLQVFFSVRSERQLAEQIDYNYCFAGSWAWAWTRWCGTMPCSRRTTTVCSRRKWRSASSPR